MNLRRIIAREWLIFVACLVVSLAVAGAIAWHAKDAAKADSLAALGAAFADPPPPEPPPLSLLNRLGQMPFRRVSTATLLGLYVTVSLIRSVFWAVKAMRRSPAAAP